MDNYVFKVMLVGCSQTMLPGVIEAIGAHSLQSSFRTIGVAFAMKRLVYPTKTVKLSIWVHNSSYSNQAYMPSIFAGIRGSIFVTALGDPESRAMALHFEDRYLELIHQKPCVHLVQRAGVHDDNSPLEGILAASKEEGFRRQVVHALTREILEEGLAVLGEDIVKNLA
jgi:hypothetical protein